MYICFGIMEINFKSCMSHNRCNNIITNALSYNLSVKQRFLITRMFYVIFLSNVKRRLSCSTLKIGLGVIVSKSGIVIHRSFVRALEFYHLLIVIYINLLYLLPYSKSNFKFMAQLFKNSLHNPFEDFLPRFFVSNVNC